MTFLQVPFKIGRPVRVGLLLAALCSLLWTPMTSADTVDNRARTLYTKAIKQYNLGDFQSALTLFNKAYGARPSYKILYNIGQTNLELHRPASALNAFEQYLRDGGDEIELDRRQAVKKEIQKLRRIVGEVIVRSQMGCECRIDDIHQGYLPLEDPIRLTTGHHLVTIHLQGEMICKKAVTIKAGKRLIVTCNPQSDGQSTSDDPQSVWAAMSGTSLLEDEIASEDQTVPVTTTIDNRPIPGPLLISAGATVVGMAVTTALAIKTAKDNSSLSGRCDNLSCDPSLQPEMDTLKREAVAADIMLVTTTVLTGLTVGLLMRWSKKRDHHREISWRQMEPTRQTEPTEVF